MKSIQEYITEKLKITKDNIDKYAQFTDILNVKIQSFENLHKLLNDYFSHIYNKDEVIIGDIRNSHGSLGWEIPKNPSQPKSSIKIPITSYFVITVNLKNETFSIHVGQETGLSRRVLFRYKATNQNGDLIKSFAIAAPREYRFVIGNNLLDWLINLKDEVIDTNCCEEIQLLKYFKIIEE